jgi:hypothetical protein
LSPKYCMQTLSQYQTMAAGQLSFFTDDAWKYPAFWIHNIRKPQ